MLSCSIVSSKLKKLRPRRDCESVGRQQRRDGTSEFSRDWHTNSARTSC